MAAEAEAAREARAKASPSHAYAHAFSGLLFGGSSFLSGYCCRGRTKSLPSTQRGLGGHFRVVLGPSASLLAGTLALE